jgi:hypothetical protein
MTRIANKPFFFDFCRQGRDAASMGKWFVVIIARVAKAVS